MKPKVKAKPPAKSRKRWLVPVVAILFILLAMWHFRSSPVDEVRRMRAQIAAMESELSPEDKQELIKKMRDQVKELTPEQRRELMMDQQKKKARQMAEFFQLSPEEKQQELDKRIDQLVTRANQPGPGQGGLGGAARRSATRRIRASSARRFRRQEIKPRAARGAAPTNARLFDAGFPRSDARIPPALAESFERTGHADAAAGRRTETHLTRRRPQVIDLVAGRIGSMRHGRAQPRFLVGG